MKTVDVWATAQLFAACPGFSRYGSDADLPLEEIGKCSRLAVSKRRSTVDARRKVAGFAIAYVSFSNDARAPLVVRADVFSLATYMDSLIVRGNSAPALSRWSAKVPDGILGLDIPIGHPAVLAVVARAGTCPRAPKQAPMLQSDVILALDCVATDKAKPTGVRLVAAGYLLMALASLRFSGAMAVFEFRKNETASRGRSRDPKSRGRPIILRATRRVDFANSNAWADVLLKSWTNDLPGKNGIERYSHSSMTNGRFARLKLPVTTLY